MKRSRLLSVLIVAFLLLQFCLSNFAISKEGKFIKKMVYSQALENNLLGDDPNRDVFIYLPPTYEDNSDKKFPVVYLLHGYTWTNTRFVDAFQLKAAFDSFFDSDTIEQMIIVLPDAFNKYKGSWFTNSYVTGNWENFMTVELIEYVDSNFRTIKSNHARGIAGWSMGGHGAITLAMKHPELYSVVYGLSAALLDFEDSNRGTMKAFLEQAVKESEFDSLQWQVQVMISQAAAFTPDSSCSPFLCKFPVDLNGELIEPIWQKWLKHDPVSMASTYKDNLLQLKRLKFDCGTSDGYLISGTRNFSQKLKNEGIPYEYLEYEGTHFNKITIRISDYMLPYFSTSFKSQ